jgi:hypothetical protein
VHTLNANEHTLPVTHAVKGGVLALRGGHVVETIVDVGLVFRSQIRLAL